jgi:hypothetical protein
VLVRSTPENRRRGTLQGLCLRDLAARGAIAGWIGRVGAAGAEHAMDRFAISRTRAYSSLSRLVASSLLE